MDRPRPAGFWIRAGALAIDVVVFVLVQRSLIVVTRVMEGISAADAWSASSLVGSFTLLFTGAYTTALHATAGQTIGKLVVGIRVTGVDSEGVTVGQAFLRWLAYGVSLATFGLGFLMAALRRDKRSLHDLIAGTRVERVRAEEILPSPPREGGDQTAPPSAERRVDVAPDVG